jgi:hypothetical protein
MASNAASLNRAKGLKGRYSKILKEERQAQLTMTEIATRDSLFPARSYAQSRRRKMFSLAMT